jgi:hypothetical protein
MNTLETNYGRFNIYVNYLPSQDGNLIHLSFVDKNNKTYVVLMRQLNGRWIFAYPDTLPDWIINLEDRFDTLVTGEILRNYQSSGTTRI